MINATQFGKLILLVCTFFFNYNASSQKNLEQRPLNSNNNDSVQISPIQLFFDKAKYPPILGDQIITVIKVLPNFFNFQIISTKENHQFKDAIFWMDSLDLNLIINAGMYNLRDTLTHKFYMKNFNSINNPILCHDANGIIAFNPKDKSKPEIKIYDLTKTRIGEIDSTYHSIIQGYRMIDDNGQPIYWDRNFQKCSMNLIAQDTANNLYFIFCRSPYSQNKMIDNLLSLPYDFRNVIYLEGGTRSCITINYENKKTKFVGSYVSGYHENDNNRTFYPIPNFIGLKLKSP